MRVIVRLSAAVVLAALYGSAPAAAARELQAHAPQVQAPAPTAPVAASPTFEEWLVALRAEALARGISRRTVDEALMSVERLPVVVDRDRTQAELTLTLDEYLKRRLPARVVRDARDAAKRQRTLLGKVTAAYGVPGSIVVAIWGLESNFGRFSGVRPAISALATLSFDTRRATMFREEIFAALQILDRGDVTISALKGSWAGAMGQPQFMPSSYLKYAVDFDADGRRDIWASTPDVLASIANYLKEHGWAAEYRWGREVRLNAATAARVSQAVPLRMTGSCTALREMSEPRPLSAWHTLGVKQVNKSALPQSDAPASLVRVDTHSYLVYANYEALLAYNCAHTYALSVALLADRTVSSSGSAR
ncbi:MAG: lytic murein transglycosylase [Acidobacteria bacterium]|nr:lytic murein transglycosylase [Acidobacteriota bacterium]